ncbi:MAG: class I SAM-dependent methyltransferase [Candidatus Hodarchaeota archaeon]
MNAKDYFDHIAPDWDHLQSMFFSPAVREKAFILAGVKKGQLAADVGAGTGYVTTGLLEHGLQVIAVDQSSAMLDVMREKFAGNQDVEFRKGDVLQLPIEDNSIDYVFANMVLHHLPQPLMGLREMIRILKPSGKLVITDIDKHDLEFLRHEQHDVWLGFERDDIHAWFAETGLQQVRVESTGEQCSSESCTGGEKAQISIFVAIGEKA